MKMQKTKPPCSAFLSVLLLLALISSFCVSIVAANPVVGPDIWVDSPKNKVSYNSGTVQLVFYPEPYTHLNYTSFSYSIDGQSSKEIDMNTCMTPQYRGQMPITVGNIPLEGLSWGSHTVVVSGVDTSGKTHSSWTVHFDVLFNTALILPAAFLIAIISLLLWGSYKKRVFEGKKTGTFWFGLVWFLFFAITCLAIVWQIMVDYVYAGYGEGVILGSMTFVFTLVFPFSLMIAGFFVMRSGLKKNGMNQPKDLSSSS
jgi:hypothetical protein